MLLLLETYRSELCLEGLLLVSSYRFFSYTSQILEPNRRVFLFVFTFSSPGNA